MGIVRLVHSKAASESLNERSDDELMRLAQGGSRAAFACLVRRHAARVVALCARFVNDAQAGQELAQDTWVQVWQNRQRYASQGGFVPWLVTVARNRCRNHLRRRGTQERYSDAASGLTGDASADQVERLLTDERRQRVRAALEDLPPPMREALLLRFAEELRYDEMTVALGAGESTLRSRVHHGMKALRKKLERS